MTESDLDETVRAETPPEAVNRDAVLKAFDEACRLRATRFKVPDEVRSRFEGCRRQIEKLKSELRERLAQIQGWHPFDTLNLYARFATETARLTAQENPSESFPDSAFSRRANEHFKFRNLWTPILSEFEVLAAVRDFGPLELIQYLTERDNLKRFCQRLGGSRVVFRHGSPTIVPGAVRLALQDEAEDRARQAADEAAGDLPATDQPIRTAGEAPIPQGPVEASMRRGRRRSKPNLHPEVEPYLDRVGKVAHKQITISEFCLVSGFRDDTTFGFWRQGDNSRCNPTHAKRFERTLTLSADQFLAKLDESASKRR